MSAVGAALVRQLYRLEQELAEQRESHDRALETVKVTTEAIEAIEADIAEIKNSGLLEPEAMAYGRWA